MSALDPPEWFADVPLACSPDEYGGGAPPPADVGNGLIKPTQFHWRSPSEIQPREWLYGHHLIRRYVSATIAPGGVGKSTLTIADAVSMATGKPLVGAKPHAAMTVWLWNGEDPRDEIERRLIAACLYHAIEPADIAGRLFIDSGRDTPIRIGTAGPNGPQIAMPVIDALIAAIRDRSIDVLVVDPFVSVHGLPENDNGAMDAAVKAFALVADRTGCAIDLVHHSRKLNGADADIDAARGGSAIAGAVRAARVLNAMSKEAAEALGLTEGDRRSFVRVDDAKANLAPPSSARWFRLTSEPLGNGTTDRPQDFVAVAEAWTPPDTMDGISLADLLAVQKAIDGQALAENVQSNRWVGHEIGRVLGLNSSAEPDKRKIKAAIKAWTATGALVNDVTYDAGKGRDVKIVNVGEWASTPP